MKKLVSGIKPTGMPTLGSYIGAIKQFVELQKEYESYLFVADLHAITVPQDKAEMRKQIKNIVALYLAFGIDPNMTTIFLQSENLYHANLGWILECNSYMGELSRMTQYKDKNIKQGNEAVTAGLFAYPVLMAGDIIMYDADVVPVGDDQKQHVELTRDLVDRFNNKYGMTFVKPEPLLSKEGARIMDLQNPLNKMSKSDEDNKGVILILDDEQTITKKVMSATTDSDNKIIFDKTNKPGISNLIEIYSSLNNISIKEVENKFIDSNYGNFKTEVAKSIINLLIPIQNKYTEIMNSTLVDEVLDKGRIKTNEIAKIKYEEVRNKVGLGR